MAQAIDFRDIRSGEPDAILAGLWRQIMRNYGMDRARLDDLVTDFSRQMSFFTEEKQSQYRGNVLSDLLAERMTWGTFLRGVRALKMRKMDFIVHLHHLRYITEHTMVKEFAPPDVDIDATPEDGKKPPTELHFLFISIMRDLGVSSTDVQNLMTKYMVRTRVPLTPKNKTHVRGNIKKDLLGERLSWASFIRGLNFLEITKFEVEIVLYPKKGRSTRHSRVIILNDAQDLREELDIIANSSNIGDTSFQSPTQ